MKKLGFTVWYGAGAAALIGLLAACGGKVTWVEDGAVQTGGAGGTGSTSSKSASSTKSATSTTNVASVQVATSVQGTSVVATSSGDVMPGCDSGAFGNPGDPVCDDCINCSIAGVCSGLYNDFLNSQDAQDFVDCLDQCGGPMCQQQCQNAHPQGAMLYGSLVDCVLCQTCPNNCNANQNCFGPPPPGTSGQGGGPTPN